MLFLQKLWIFRENFEIFSKILSFLRFSSRIRFDKWMPKLHKSWTINFWKWRDAERWRKVNYSVVMVDTKPPLVHQGAIQFMEIWNLKFHKIHKKSKTLVKTVFNRHIFERSVMVSVTGWIFKPCLIWYVVSKSNEDSESILGFGYCSSDTQNYCSSDTVRGPRLVRRRGRKLRLVPNQSPVKS